MDIAIDELNLTKTAGRLATHVFSGTFVTYVVAFFGTIILARLLSPSDFGLLSVSLFVPSLLMFAGDIGVGNAAIKYTAELRAKVRGSEAVVIYTGLTFDLGLGAMLAVVGVVLSTFISQDIFAKPNITPLVSLASLQAFSLMIYNFVYASLLGLEEARIVGAMSPAYYLVQYGTGPILYLYGFGVAGIVIGYVVGPLASALVALLILVRKVPPARPSLKVLKRMVNFGGPVSGGNALITLLGQFYNFMVGRFASVVTIGYYGVATRLSFLNYLVSSPINSAVYPTISKLDPTKDAGSIRKVFHYSLKLVTILQVPLGVWVVLFPRQLVELIFGEAYVGASIYVVLYALLWLYIGSGDALLQVVLLGTGKTSYIAKFSLYGLLGGVALGTLLIPTYGIIGLQVALLINQWPSYVMLLRYCRSTIGVVFPVKSLAKIYLSASLGGALVAPIAMLSIAYYFQIALSAPAMLLVYVYALAKFRAVDNSDLTVFENSLSGLPYLNRAAGLLFSLIRRII